MVSSLRNVAPELAQAVADGLGLRDLPPAMPKARDGVMPEVATSKALSLFARPGDGSIKARKVAFLIANGFDAAPVQKLADRMAADGAVPRLLGPRIGAVESASGEAVEADASVETTPSVLYDAVVLAGGAAAVKALAANGQVLEFIKDQYRHCKTILAFEGADALLRAAGIPATLPDGTADRGLIVDASAAGADAFVEALARHRHFERETDPPRV
jgi:catalase